MMKRRDFLTSVAAFALAPAVSLPSAAASSWTPLRIRLTSTGTDTFDVGTVKIWIDTISTTGPGEIVLRLGDNGGIETTGYIGEPDDSYVADAP